jgi:hypothetical protein
MNVLIVAHENFNGRDLKITVPLRQIQDMDKHSNFKLSDIYEILLAQMKNLKEGKYK